MKLGWSRFIWTWKLLFVCRVRTRRPWWRSLCSVYWYTPLTIRVTLFIPPKGDSNQNKWMHGSAWPTLYLPLFSGPPPILTCTYLCPCVPHPGIRRSTVWTQPMPSKSLAASCLHGMDCVCSGNGTPQKPCMLHGSLWVLLTTCTGRLLTYIFSITCKDSEL